eukprot:74082-Rhodomonas_salina.1
MLIVSVSSFDPSNRNCGAQAVSALRRRAGRAAECGPYIARDSERDRRPLQRDLREALFHLTSSRRLLEPPTATSEEDEKTSGRGGGQLTGTGWVHVSISDARTLMYSRKELRVVPWVAIAKSSDFS